MAQTWMVGEEQLLAIDLSPYDIYGASGFQLLIKEKDATEATPVEGDFTEVIEAISSPVSTTLASNASAGSTEIVVSDASAFTVGMRVKIANSEIKYVAGVDTVNNKLIFRRPLKTDYSSGSSVVQVGNTGIYERKLTLNSVGQYILIVNNPSIGLLNESTKVYVVDKDLRTISDQIATHDSIVNNKLDEVLNNLGSGGGATLSGRLIV